MNLRRRVGMAAASVALAAGLVVTEALISPPTAWAQSGSIVPFTPAGFDTTSYTIPDTGAQRAGVIVGFLNDTDASVTITAVGVINVSVAGHGQAEAPSISPGGMYVNSLEFSAPGTASLFVKLSNGEQVTWTVNGNDLAQSLRQVLPGGALGTDPTAPGPITLEPPLVGAGYAETVQVSLGAVSGSVENSACTVTAPFVVESGSCSSQTSEDGDTLTTATIDVPVQSSLADWSPGQHVAELDWSGRVSFEGGSPLQGFVAVPVLYTVPPAVSSETTVEVSGSAPTAVEFVAAPNGSNLAATSATLSGVDASDFTATLTNSAAAPPSDGGTWTPVDVRLTATKRGNYSADLTVEFDPSGTTFSVTIPVTGAVSGQITGITGMTGSTMPPTPVAFTPPPPDPVAVGETCGAAGTKVQIWGENLAGSVVRFANATSGAVEVLSPTEVQATVPHGVDGLGPIAVVGPDGQAEDVPGVTWNPACQTHTLAWTTPGGPGQVVLHVALVSADSSIHCLSDKTVVVLGRDGEQVAKFETGAEPTTLVLPVAEGPYTAVFDGDVHCAPSQSGAVA